MPDWLPDMFCIDPWTQNTYDLLYRIFCRNIRDHELRYMNNEVWIFPEMEDGKEKYFGILQHVLPKQEKFLAEKRNFILRTRHTLRVVDSQI